MKIFSKKTLIGFFTLLSCVLFSQNETSKWYFGNQAGLDFMTNPPTILTNGAMSTGEGCSSIANSTGGLLFYTDGLTVWNQNHVPMANGTGMFGSPSTSQSGVIVKKPGSSTIYYVFTLTSGFGSLYYSEIDMTLAAGMGSVTIKNYSLAVGLTEHLTSVRHCNGTDIWVLCHQGNSSNTFNAFKVTSAGVITTPVVSSVGTLFGNFFIGCMKFSPNGKKLGFAVAGNAQIEVFDFDNSTGTLSNPISIGSSVVYPYGVEFSPDGTKLYSKGNNAVGQWDLCAGSATAIAASTETFATVVGIGSLQLANNGKIYVARFNQSILGVVNNPNLAGTLCNYVDLGQSIAPKISNAGLPNFITSGFNPPLPPFTFSVNCSNAYFSPPSSTTTSGCSASSTISSVMTWFFGDPASGTANTSTLTNPTHAYSSSGTYTAVLVLNSTCSADTIKLPVTISNTTPSLSVAGTFTICNGDKRVYVASGATNYTWSNNATASTISLSPTITTIYNVSSTGTNSCTGNKTFTITVNKCTGVELISNQEDGLKIYPNPTNGLLNIETEKPIKVVTSNSLGKIISESFFEAGKFTMDIKDYENGIYTLKSMDTKGTKIIRLVKTD